MSQPDYSPGVNLIFRIVAIGLASVCVWLTVRIVTRRERWAKRTALGLITGILLYVPSVGPMLWIVDHTERREWVREAYKLYCVPVQFLYDTFPKTVGATIEPYLRLWRKY